MSTHSGMGKLINPKPSYSGVCKTLKKPYFYNPKKHISFCVLIKNIKSGTSLKVTENIINLKKAKLRLGTKIETSRSGLASNTFVGIKIEFHRFHFN